MPELKPDDAAEWGELGELIDRVRARLQPGGPPVDQELLLDFLVGDLADDAKRLVTERVRTWENWHREYWKLRSYSDQVEAAESRAEVSSGNSLPPPIAAPRSRRWIPAVMGVLAASILLAVAGTAWRGRDPLNRLTGVPSRWRGEVSTMLATSTISLPQGVLGRFAGLRSSAARSMYLRPNKTYVREDRPRFAWQGRTANDRYQVFVYRGEADAPILSPILTDTAWQPEEPLTRGVDYTWEVKTIRGEDVLLSAEPRAPFVILDEDGVAEVEAATSDASLPVLARVAALIHFGLLDEARSLLTAAHEQYPHSAVAQTLLDSLDRQR